MGRRRYMSYSPKKFTKKIFNVLHGHEIFLSLSEYDEIDVVKYICIPANELLKASKYILKRNIEDRHND